MGTVMVTCPVTGKELFTGIETDNLSLCRCPNFVGRVYCPFCAVEHRWSKEHAWVCELSYDGLVHYDKVVAESPSLITEAPA